MTRGKESRIQSVKTCAVFIACGILAVIFSVMMSFPASSKSARLEYNGLNSICIITSIIFQNIFPLELDTNRISSIASKNIESSSQSIQKNISTLPVPKCYNATAKVFDQLYIEFTATITSIAKQQDIYFLAIVHVARRWSYASGTLGTNPRVFTCSRSNSQLLEECLANHVSEYFDNVILPKLQANQTPTGK